jgi:hypothetical protein
MAQLIVQVTENGSGAELMRRDAPAGVRGGHAVVVELASDAAGRLDAPAAGEVVMSVLSPEALVRDRDELHRAIEGAGGGSEPLVVVVEAAEELREEELDAVLTAARRSRRAVILRIERDA